jgi:hypothetical protein
VSQKVPPRRNQGMVCVMTHNTKDVGLRVGMLLHHDHLDMKVTSLPGCASSMAQPSDFSAHVYLVLCAGSSHAGMSYSTLRAASSPGQNKTSGAAAASEPADRQFFFPWSTGR